MIDLISVHVPKTAGHTFNTILQQVHYDVKYDYASDDATEILKDDIFKTDRSIAIHGHFKAKKYDSMLPSVKKVIWLRNPVDQLLAIYSHFIERNSYKMGYNYKDFVTFFTKYKDNKNITTKYMQGMQLEDFYFYGIVERYNEDIVNFLTLLAKIKPIKRMAIEQGVFKNVNSSFNYMRFKDAVYNNTDNMLDFIHDYSRKDIQLYNKAVELKKCN